jgi:hypothetical protein
MEAVSSSEMLATFYHMTPEVSVTTGVSISCVFETETGMQELI